MQATEILNERQLHELADCVFDLEKAEVFSADSEFGKELEGFGSAEESRNRHDEAWSKVLEHLDKVFRATS